MQNPSYILSVIDMYINAAVHKTGIIIKALVVFTLCALLIIFSESCASGATKGLEQCLKILIPSLFPFMAVSSFIVKSGLSYKIGKPFGKITKALFGLNGSFAPIILLSMLGGYPVGAKGIATLKKCGCATEKEAQKAAMFSVCAGPGFIVNFVGVSLYQNKTIGFIILVSQIISVLVLGILINITDKDRKNYNSNSELKIKPMSISNAVVESAIDSSKGILSICAFVVLFSAFTGITDSLITNIDAENVLFCLLEVCTAVDELSKNHSVEFVAFALGYGGLCVHFQIFSALRDIKISKLLFFFIRIIQGLITSLLTHIGIMIFLKEQAVFSSSNVESANTFGGTLISGAVLIGVSICFLYSLKTNIKQR